MSGTHTFAMFFMTQISFLLKFALNLLFIIIILTIRHSDIYHLDIPLVKYSRGFYVEKRGHSEED